MLSYTKLLLFAVLTLVLCLGTAMAQDEQHGPTVPPDPDDGGCCTCGFWACLFGTCQQTPCSISAIKIPMPDSSKGVGAPNYTPFTLTPLICGKNPTNRVSEQPPPTNTTYPIAEPDVPDIAKLASLPLVKPLKDICPGATVFPFMGCFVAN